METFKLKQGDVTREVMVRSAKAIELKEANKVKSRAYWKAVKDGLPMASDAIKMAQKTSWTPEKLEEYTNTQKDLAHCEEILTKKRNLKLGGPKDSNDDTMFRIALKCFNLRNKLIKLNTEFAEAQENTVEGYSENERLNYLLYATTVYKDSGERVFASYDDFENSTLLTEDNADKYEIVVYAFRAYQEKLMDGVQHIVDNNPENAFFKRFKFVNDKGEFIDNDGNLIDSGGKAVESEEIKLEKPHPYLDNDGNPIEDDEYKAELAKYEAALAEQKTQKPNKT